MTLPYLNAYLYRGRSVKLIPRKFGLLKLLFGAEANPGSATVTLQSSAVAIAGMPFISLPSSDT